MMIKKYFYNTITDEIITYDDFVSRCKKYKKDFNSEATIHEIMYNDDEVIYIGKFSSIEEAINWRQENV